MDILDKKIEIMELYDVYQNLLTKKQRDYVEAYYYDDMSITEISEEFEVSRNAVHDQLKRTVSKMKEFEAQMNIRFKMKKRSKLIEKIKVLNDQLELEELIEELEKVE
jgi:predicted DNA-binding protein YlxM (UPF0122 family)